MLEVQSVGRGDNHTVQLAFVEQLVIVLSRKTKSKTLLYLSQLRRAQPANPAKLNVVSARQDWQVVARGPPTSADQPNLALASAIFAFL